MNTLFSHSIGGILIKSNCTVTGGRAWSWQFYRRGHYNSFHHKYALRTTVSRAQVAFNTALSNKCSASALRSSFYFYFPNPHSINEFEVKHA